jgi:gliding motility-associated-like protein
MTEGFIANSGGFDIYQFDVSSGITTTIVGSKTFVGRITTAYVIVGSIQMGPDGKLYIARQDMSFLGIIPLPDLHAPACGFIKDGLSLANKKSNVGLPNSIRMTSALQASFSVGPDRFKCNMDTIHLGAPAGFLNYSWSPNYNISSTSSPNVVITPFVDTSYVVKAEKIPGCFISDTIKIKVFHSPQIDLGKELRFCIGDSASLNSGFGFSSYLWNTGMNSREVVVKNPGTYSVIATTSEGCKSADTVNVLPFYDQPFVQLEPQEVLCYATPLRLDGGNFPDYLWSTGETSQAITINTPGIYWLKVLDSNGCKGIDSTIVDDCRKKFFMPNAFTPGNDGRNDLIAPVLYGSVKQYRFIIYNRWGEIIFETTNLNKGWDGAFHGKPLETASFIWACTFQFEGIAQEFKKGSFILIR